MPRDEGSMVKTNVENMTKMKFAKVSSKVNYIMRTVSEIINVLMNLSETCKEEIRNKLNMIQKMEDDDIFKECIIATKAFHGGYTMFESFINAFNEELNNEILAHER